MNKNQDNKGQDNEIQQLASLVRLAIARNAVCLSDVVSLTPDEGLALERAAEKHLVAGQPQLAGAIYGMLLSGSPLTGRYWRQMAEVQLRRGEYACACACYQVWELLGDPSPRDRRREAICRKQLGVN